MPTDSALKVGTDHLRRDALPNNAVRFLSLGV